MVLSLKNISHRRTGRTLFGTDFDLELTQFGAARFGANLIYPTIRVRPPFFYPLDLP